MGNWRIRLTVTEQQLEATHPRTNDRFFEYEANDQVAAINNALAAVFAEAGEHRSSILGIFVDHPLEMP